LFAPATAPRRVTDVTRLMKCIFGDMRWRERTGLKIGAKEMREAENVLRRGKSVYI